MQKILLKNVSEEKEAVLWVLSNSLVNSERDLQTIIKHGILGFVAVACRDNNRKVK